MGESTILVMNFLCIVSDHAYLGCTQRECKPNEGMVDEYREMFESRISEGAPEKLLGWEKSHANTIAWSCDVEGHAKNAFCCTANWQTKQSSNCVRSPHNVLTTIISKKNSWKRFGTVKSLLSNRLEMHVFGTHWKTGHSFYGQQTNLHPQSQNGPNSVTDAWLV